MFQNKAKDKGSNFYKLLSIPAAFKHASSMALFKKQATIFQQGLKIQEYRQGEKSHGY